MSATDDLEALQDKVFKLNSILAVYREKFGSLSSDPETSTSIKTPTDSKIDENAPEVPWFVDRRILSPILKDYDNMIDELRQQYNTEALDTGNLINSVKNLTEENKRLKRQLIQRINYKENNYDNDSSQESSHRPATPALETEEAKAELERKLRETQAELSSCRWQIKELRSTLDQLMAGNKDSGLIAMPGVKSVRLSQDTALNTQIEELKHLLKNYGARISGKFNQAPDLEEEKMQVLKQMEILKQKAHELEQKDVKNLEQMMANKRLAEEALEERDQCIAREKQANEEISRLQDLLQKVIQEAGLKSRQEVHTIKTEQRLMQERLEFQLQKYKEENAEIKNILDQVKREKASLQDELKAVIERLEETEGTKKLGRDDLTIRMFNAERTRDETLLKLSLLEDKFVSLETEHKKDMERLMDELKQARERLVKSMSEFDRLSEEKEKSISEVFNLRNVMSKLETEKDASMRHLSKELLAFQQLLKTKEKEHEARLVTIEDEHRHSLGNLKESISGQQRIAFKLKEDMNTMIKNLESTIASLKGELLSEKKDKTEAIKLLKDSKSKTKETEMRLRAFSKNIEILESRLCNTENRENMIQNQVRRNNLIKGLSLADARRSEMRDIEQSLKETMSWQM